MVVLLLLWLFSISFYVLYAKRTQCFRNGKWLKGPLSSSCCNREDEAGGRGGKESFVVFRSGNEGNYNKSPTITYMTNKMMWLTEMASALILINVYVFKSHVFCFLPPGLSKSMCACPSFLRIEANHIMSRAAFMYLCLWVETRKRKSNFFTNTGDFSFWHLRYGGRRGPKKRTTKSDFVPSLMRADH